MGQGSSNSRPPRVLVVGLDGAGKTCLLRRLARQEIALTAPTHGFQIVRLEFGGKPVELIDVGGREELRAQWHVYYRGLAGLVFVLDAADKRRLEEAGVELNKLLCEPLLAHVPTLIVANKHDVIDALPAHKVVDALNLGAVRDREWMASDCSALDRRGVDEAFTWILGQVVAAKAPPPSAKRAAKAPPAAQAKAPQKGQPAAAGARTPLQPSASSPNPNREGEPAAQAAESDAATGRAGRKARQRG